jgi:hypothetical protein
MLHPNPYPSVHLVASPSTVEAGGDVVITWKNLMVAPNDSLALSCGPTINDKDDYLMLHKISDHTTMSARFDNLHMLRCSYVVKYIRANGTTIDEITIPMRDSINAPKQGHLAFNDHIDQMVIMFNSASSRTPWVKYVETRSMTATTTTTDDDDHDDSNHDTQKKRPVIQARRGTSTTYHASDM